MQYAFAHGGEAGGRGFAVSGRRHPAHRCNANHDDGDGRTYTMKPMTPVTAVYRWMPWSGPASMRLAWLALSSEMTERQAL
jgi:hypothetical protein